MKVVFNFSFLFTLLIFGSFSCNKAISLDNCYPDRIINKEEISGVGTIIKITDDYVIESNNSRYITCSIPKELQQEGVVVTFSGVTHEIYPHERWAATPTTLKSIAKAKQ